MWSAACGQAAEDLEFFVYRAVDVRRRWSCACLLVLFCRCVAPDHALCLVSVLSAYSLQASCVVFEALRVCLWLLLDRRGDGRVFCGVRRAVSARERLWAGSRGETSWRASGALAASRDVFVSLAKFRAHRAASGLVAALLSVQSSRGDGRHRRRRFRP